MGGVIPYYGGNGVFTFFEMPADVERVVSPMFKISPRRADGDGDSVYEKPETIVGGHVDYKTPGFFGQLESSAE